MNSILFLCVYTIFIVLGNILAKKWIITSNVSFMILSLMCYTVSTLIFFPIFKMKGLILSTMITTCAIVIAGLIIGTYYGETLTLRYVVGMILGVISMIILLT